MIDIKIKRLHKDAKLPTRATAESAGYDVYSYDDYQLFRGSSIIVPLGFSVEIPKGYELQVRSRSGLAFKEQVFVTNSPGTIDSDYRGEVKVLLSRLKHVESACGTTCDVYQEDRFRIRPGDRIAQLVLAVVPESQIVEVTDIVPTDRGVGGFGSTGA